MIVTVQGLAKFGLSMLTLLAFGMFLLCVLAEMNSPIPDDTAVRWSFIIFILLLVASIASWVWL